MSARDGHVRMLPLQVANKIAAGEVVERPASVVKELMENALDAGAKHITVAVSAGGRKLVSVRDDGCGMTRDDATLSLERQATSKILDVDDIERIDTLGFRGEAIPSIASVSRFSITTRRAGEDVGTYLLVNAGTLAEVRDAGCPEGTIVEVRDLFCNVPARKKFLRAYATEENHVREIFIHHALAHPEVGFTLVFDGREQFRLAPALSLADRVRELFGAAFLEGLVPITPAGGEPENGISVSGFIGRPAAFTVRRDQYLFVNARPASAPVIAGALREGFPSRAGENRPPAIIFITLPPTEVDVNVHPTKREVRFRNSAAVRQAILKALDRALDFRGGAAAIPSAADLPRPALESGALAPTYPGDATAAGAAGAVIAPYDLPADEFPPAEASSAPLASSVLPAPSTPPAALPTAAPVEVELPLAADADGRARPWAWYKYLAVTDRGFILLETDAGIVTMNPKAALERVTFERLKRPESVQPLLLPQVVELPPTDAARIRAALEAIRGAGFELEEFGRDTFIVRAVPQLHGEIDVKEILPTLAADLADGTARRGENWREERIARSVAKACAGRMAHLDEPRAKDLVDALIRCRNPYVDPRGRPVMIFTSNNELNRKFAIQ